MFRYAVLILVVMEDGLVLRSIVSLIKKLKNVLILIVVDNGLVRLLVLRYN